MSDNLFNLKNLTPSTRMSAPAGLHYRCSWIENSITIHSDGNVTCGLDDPHGQRSFGNIHSQSIKEIFGNPEYRNLRSQLWSGRHCLDCGHFRPADETNDPSNDIRPDLPSELVIETTVKCNIRCPNPPCLANNDPSTRTRNANSLTWDAFKRVVDELEGNLRLVRFYNYGEPFVNREAEPMLAYLREKCPAAYIVTSTNGILLSNCIRAEKVVAAAPDEVTFTISGVTQEGYGRYHARGDLAKALAGLRNVCAAKKAQARRSPRVVWRYLVFKWNDTDDEIDRAIVLAQEYGVDQLSLYLTDVPPGARSIRFSPGSPSFLKYLEYIHHDSEGRLDHGYHCELPDRNGLYQVEELPGLGRARWTASRAAFRYDEPTEVLRLAVSTNREMSRLEAHTCRIGTPWAALTVPLTCNRWAEISLSIPSNYWGRDGFEVSIATDDYWFPAQELVSRDLRCLGVLLKADAAR